MLRQNRKPIKNNPCKYCGKTNHTSLQCFDKPRLPIKLEADKTKSRRTATTREWFELNPPDPKGLYYCYLRISERCPRYLTCSTVTLEHVKSKVRHPELKYDVNNLRPACGPCNKLKGSKDIVELAMVYPHLRALAMLYG